MVPLDEIILPKEFKMMKAFLPFLPAAMQKMFAIYIKWTELRLTIEYFNQHPPVQETPDMKNIMKCIKGVLPPEEGAQIDQFLDLFENMDLYQEMFEGFSSAFTPDQKEENL